MILCDIPIAEVHRINNRRTHLQEKIIVIQGMTNNKKVFRPSDWPQRLAGLCATLSTENRIIYSALVTPSIETCCGKGVHCLRIHPSLQEMNKGVYDHIIAFARENDLIVHEK